MADIAVIMVDTRSNMPRPAMLRANTLASALTVTGTPETVERVAVNVATILRGPRAATRALQVAHIIGMAAVTGEAVTGIRLMDILGSAQAITGWAMAIHTTGVAITVTATVGTIRTTDIGDTTLTYTDIGRP